MVISELHEINQVLSINEKNRTVDTTEDLIHISNVYPKKFNTYIPIFAPITWDKYKYIDQENYIIKFSELFPIAALLIDKVENIVIAGGAAAKPLYVSKNTESIQTDIDIFIYGLSDYEFWQKVNEIVEVIYLLSLYDNINIVQKIKQGIVIVIIQDIDTGICTEYQIILREYKTLSAIIHSFDIPSCCIAYDGTNTYLTSLAAYAYSYQINLVCTKYRSPTYEKRLCKYFYRGFALGLIEFNKNIAASENIWETPYITLEVKSRINSIIALGVIKNVFNIRSYISSDYASIPNTVTNYKELINLCKNIETIGITIAASEKYKQIDYTEFYKMSVECILQYTNSMNLIIDRIIKKIKFTNLNNLLNIGISKNVIKKIVINMFSDEYNEDEIKKILMDEIFKYSNYVPNWILSHDPNKQFTSSICPIIEDASKWYGSSYEPVLVE